MIGNNVFLTTQTELTDFFRSQFLMHIKSNLAKVIKNSGEELIGINAQQEVIANELSKIIAKIFDEYGICLQTFSVESIDVVDNENRQKLEDAISSKSVMGILGDNWERQKQFELMRDAANNPGGIAGAGAGLGMGSAFASMANGMFNNSNGFSQGSAVENPLDRLNEKTISSQSSEDIVLPSVTQGTRRPITDEERAMILETAKNHYAGTMVLTMLYCGLRPIEIRRMEWDWLDFENSILTVGKSKTEAGTGRKIPIPPQLKSALIEHKLKGFNDKYVFVRVKNNKLPLDENAFYHAWHNFCREMDIANGATVYRNQITKSTLASDLEPYLLRHTFCTDCQTAGVPLNVARN